MQEGVLNTDQLNSFVERVRDFGQRLYRDFPWRGTSDAYAVLVSEIMLQQTQVSRVLARWHAWLEVFPSIDALAAASLADVLERWQGMGYNRRAIAIKRCADTHSEQYGGQVPCDYDALIALPGVGPATAAGVCVFAYQLPFVYLETNVRTVFIHEFFAERERVSDHEIIPLIKQTCPDKDPRSWYYALLDYGAYLKKSMPNPSRRSTQYHRQSTFIGSVRQKRAELLRLILGQAGLSTDELAEQLSALERIAGRQDVPMGEIIVLLEALEREGFLTSHAGNWFISSQG
ncbi:MAG: adenine glycosylase [Coriobacteriia bacterium]|nr:adenine glycosylase [Coriobacteriia bacterium]